MTAVAATRARTRLALGATRLGGSLSRSLGAGSGSVVGGRIGLLIEPDLLRLLAIGRRVVVVSGTNGKTTTTRLVAEALRASRHPVASSEAGANMPEGMVAALAAAPAAAVAVLEADEAYLPVVLAATRPEVVVLLNLSRDQLDRTSEVRMLAARWQQALAGLAGTVVANADDPLVVWAAGAGSGSGGPGGKRPARVLFVGAGSAWRDDAHHCPACDARIGFDGGSWSCSSCGLRRPETVAELVGDELVAAGGSRRPLALALPGRFNRANAALALIAATAMGVEESQAAAALAAVREVAGRFADVAAPGGRARLLLAKNPAGWAELLELLREGDGPLVISINARLADGHDPSWLWDVPFELLEGRLVVATGERRLDLAVRLLHAGVGHEVVADPLAALGRATALAGGSGSGSGGSAGSGGRVDAIGNYTAFQDLRRLTGAGAGPGAGGVASASPPVPVAAAPARPGVRGREAGTVRRLGGESALRVVVVHPDLLGTYGDGGNGQVLANRAAWRGLATELVLARSDRPLPRSGDIYCLGGGEDGPQARSCALLDDGSLAAAVDAGAVVLAVCAGFQIIGRRFPGADGSAIDGLGLLDVTTSRQRRPRAVGEIVAETLVSRPLLAQGLLLSGFENHASTTTVGPGAAPLARVRTGTGNDGGGLEGAVAGRVLGTYLHGPVLARNPALADALLALAIGTGGGDPDRGGGGGGLAPLEDGEEQALLAERLRASAPASEPAPAGRGRARHLGRAAAFIEQLAGRRV